jgi:hypothetical protein
MPETGLSALTIYCVGLLQAMVRLNHSQPGLKTHTIAALGKILGNIAYYPG